MMMMTMMMISFQLLLFRSGTLWSTVIIIQSIWKRLWMILRDRLPTDCHLLRKIGKTGAQRWVKHVIACLFHSELHFQASHSLLVFSAPRSFSLIEFKWLCIGELKGCGFWHKSIRVPRLMPLAYSRCWSCFVTASAVGLKQEPPSSSFCLCTIHTE